MSDFLTNTDNILSNFPTCLRPNIEELCLRSTVGFLPINLEDIGINPTLYRANGEDLGNFHFILKVPYAGKRLKWEVIFDPEDLYFTPDFDFNDDEFLNYPDIDSFLEKVPSWKNWDLKDPKALSQVLNVFLNLFKQYQIEKLHLENIYSRYSEEYKALVTEKGGIAPENVEVIVEANSVHFLIHLKIDCSSLPEYIQPIIYKGNNLTEHTLYNQGGDFAHLKVSVSKLDGSRSNYSIQLSPRLEQVLVGFRFTSSEFKRDTPLTEVVSLVSSSLNNRLQQIVNHYQLKKIYVVNLETTCFRNIIEYDALTYTKVVFIYNIDDYNCLVTVTIGPKFPVEKPKVVLSSVYCFEACTLVVDKYPYNASLKPEVNIEHLLEFLHDVVQHFKDHKHY